ncbi:hypothetical protein SDC9_127822 [bioreactor metagenome]|uniref:Uncharacterized protein n=1 Tax=bioreactor metagenome TaxID=1076179 RepID=A0A645CVP4_9ZZZZ
MVDEDTLVALIAEDDVLHHRHGFHEHEVLVYHADAEANRFGRRVDFNLFAAEVNGTLRRLIQADEHVHQRAFSCAIFAKQGVYFAFAHIKIDVLVGIEVPKLLADMLHTENLAHRPRPLPEFRRMAKRLPGTIVCVFLFYVL